jgi:hypothetical protein
VFRTGKLKSLIKNLRFQEKASRQAEVLKNGFLPFFQTYASLPENFDSADIEKLRAEIHSHTQKVSKTMRANLERWRIEE